MKTKDQGLAAVFTQIEQAANAVEKVSEGVLAAIKEANAKTLEQFDAMVTAAFELNGWSRKPGRPGPDATEKAAPRAVKLYVSVIRAAYRFKLKVLTYENMEAIRKDLKKARAAAQVRPVVREPEFKGVQVSDGSGLTGAFWHDVLVLSMHLPEEQRQLFQGQVKKLFDRYVKEAPQDMLQSA